MTTTNSLIVSNLHGIFLTCHMFCLDDAYLTITENLSDMININHHYEMKRIR